MDVGAVVEGSHEFEELTMQTVHTTVFRHRQVGLSGPRSGCSVRVVSAPVEASPRPGVLSEAARMLVGIRGRPRLTMFRASAALGHTVRLSRRLREAYVNGRRKETTWLDAEASCEARVTRANWVRANNKDA